jgi:hypothetical protein
MDAASAAAMSDPDRNPHFRRRWVQPTARPRVVPVVQPPDGTLGAIGIALLKSWRRARYDRSPPAATDHTCNPVEEDTRPDAAALLRGT